MKCPYCESEMEREPCSMERLRLRPNTSRLVDGVLYSCEVCGYEFQRSGNRMDIIRTSSEMEEDA